MAHTTRVERHMRDGRRAERRADMRTQAELRAAVLGAPEHEAECVLDGYEADAMRDMLDDALSGLEG